MASFYILFSILLILLLLLKTKSSSVKGKLYKLPPGPWTLPVIGSIHHLIGSGLPHHVLCNLSRRYGHLMSLRLGEQHLIVVSSKEAAREVLKTHDLKFCDRPLYPTARIISQNGTDISFSPYGEYWREVKKICVSELLSPKRVKSFRSVREEEVKNMIKHIHSLSVARQHVNLSDAFSILTNTVTLRAFMGSNYKDQGFLMREIRKGLEITSSFCLANMYQSSNLVRKFSMTINEAEKCIAKLNSIIENIIRERRENLEMLDGDAEDLLTAVIQRLNDKDSKSYHLSIDNIKSFIIDIIGAGTDTVASTINWAMVELVKNPRVMKKVQTELRQQLEAGHDSITASGLGELHYLQLIIKETLRMHPPLPLLIPRECRETCNILGYDIPKGASVLINAWALGRDSKYWENPEEFRPERFDAPDGVDHMTFNGAAPEFVPFGAGRRACPGMSFGLAIVELALANVLYHFDWELPHGVSLDELDVNAGNGSAIENKSALCLLAQPYKH